MLNLPTADNYAIITIMNNMQIRLSGLAQAEKLQVYIYHTMPVLNIQALFADASANYVKPQEPKEGETVTFRFRTARNNVEHVYLCLGEKRIKMESVSHTEWFDFYEGTCSVGRKTVSYYFEVNSGETRYFYNQKGPVREADPEFHFRITPGFSTPDWAKGAVFYQIYVDRFANGDPANDVLDHEYSYIDQPVHKVDDWSSLPEAMDVRNFYGGDLQGILDHLDYLEDLGVDVIYLNPIFVSPSNHKYDIQDYDFVDPHFGKIVVDDGELLPETGGENTSASRYIRRVTDRRNLEASNKFFVDFVKEVHRRGMKVILDGVFNHCGSFNKWLDAERIYEKQPGYEKGAYIDRNSPYRDFFKFYDMSAWPYNGEYDGWWGHKTLPKLNYEKSMRLRTYIMHIGKKWVSPPYNADGWRLDVAADLGQSEEFNHSFWKNFRRAVKEANPNAIILAEHYGDPSAWLEGDQWDTVMNYSAFMEPVTWFLTGMEKHSDEKRPDLLANTQAFRDAMVYHMSKFQYGSLQTAMNELSNHDHSRFLTRTNMTVGRTASLGPEAADQQVNKAVMRSGVIMQMTWPGAPTIYYGDEAGMTGWTDPDNRRTYPWGHEDQEMIRFHRDVIAIHKTDPALMEGSLQMLETPDGTLAYGRFTDQDKTLVLINASDKTHILSVPVWEIGVGESECMNQVLFSDENGYSLESRVFRVNNGLLELVVPGISGVILRAVEMDPAGLGDEDRL